MDLVFGELIGHMRCCASEDTLTCTNLCVGEVRMHADAYACHSG